MADDTLNQLTDVALRIKGAIEDKNMEALRPLLEQNVKININGRFLTMAQLLSRLKELLDKMEQPSLDIISIEECDVQEKSAFVAYDTEFYWIDQQTWEEHSIRGLMSLQFSKGEKDWVVSGFTFSQRPKPEERIPEEPREVTPGPGLRPTTFGLEALFSGIDSLFSFWY
ncbi:MAG: hypothetical protein ACE5JA_07445 [bacterium]